MVAYLPQRVGHLLSVVIVYHGVLYGGVLRLHCQFQSSKKKQQRFNLFNSFSQPGITESEVKWAITKETKSEHRGILVTNYANFSRKHSTLASCSQLPLTKSKLFQVLILLFVSLWVSLVGKSLGTSVGSARIKEFMRRSWVKGRVRQVLLF